MASFCDNCGHEMTKDEHELRLSDLTTGQLLGRYHTKPECMRKAHKYFVGGAVIKATVVHPDRCGEEIEHCVGPET